MHVAWGRILSPTPSIRNTKHVANRMIRTEVDGSNGQKWRTGCKQTPNWSTTQLFDEEYANLVA